MNAICLQALDKQTIDEDVNGVIELIASGRANVAPMATHHLPVDDAQRGFELAMTKDDGAIKVVSQF